MAPCLCAGREQSWLQGISAEEYLQNARIKLKRIRNALQNLNIPEIGYQV